MPSYDSSRDRLRLADRHIAALGHLVKGGPVPGELDQSVTELRDAGLVAPDDRISPVLAELIGVLDLPVVVIQVEVSGEHGVLNSGIVTGAESAIAHSAWPGEEESEYVPIEPAMLPWELARMVNLRRSEDDAAVAGAPVVESTVGTLDAVFADLGQLPAEELEREGVAAERARAVLAEAGGLDEAPLSCFVDLITSLKASWRISVTWQGKAEDGTAPEVRGLAVWDCGAHGYWHRQSPAEPVLPGQPTPETALRLVRVSKGEVWEMFADLFPGSADIATAD
ncbi:hypothetical protein ACQUSR_19065 [Streptomyces sp. P1-3]|uniref:hypothetical protein n=1 Tax=Streptomyces sp. P1-3 TaxID=3421658 RepID=UPI003D36E698